jgi:hypothetical protein
MPDSYYPEGEGSFSDTSTTATPENSSPDEAKNQADDSDETALVPNEFFGDTVPEAGHICRVKVVHCYDSECEIQYLGSDEKDSGDEGEGSQMDRSMGTLSSMADRNSSAY